MGFSRKNIIILIIVGIILVQVLVYLRILPGRKPEPPPSSQLSFWGFQDNPEVWREIIQKFEEKYPNISVQYRQLDEQTYDHTILNKMAEGSGPDIFMLPNNLLMKYKEKIYPLPQQALSFSGQDFRSMFVDIAANDLISPDGNIFGLPLFIDTPALFYNKDIFNAAGITQPPKNWEEAAIISRKLTEKNAVGEIIKSGLPLGTYSNIDNAFEIISSLILQEGDPIITLAPIPRVILGEEAAKGLDFYTSFANPLNERFSWSNRLPQSLTAFAENTSAFVFGFSDDISRIQAKNPHMNLGIVSFPQKKEVRFPVVFGRYFFPTVSRFTKSPLAAWQFVNFITRDNGIQIYIAETNRPPARRDLLSQKPPVPELNLFYRQVLIAKAWPMPDDTATKNLFEGAVNSIVSRTATPFEAAANLKRRLDLLLP